MRRLGRRDEVSFCGSWWCTFGTDSTAVYLCKLSETKHTKSEGFPCTAV